MLLGNVKRMMIFYYRKSTGVDFRVNLNNGTRSSGYYLVHLEGLVSNGSSYLRESIVKSRWAATIFCSREMIS